MNSEPYEQGAEAYRAGDDADSCPHPDASLAALSWFNGWRRARYEDTGES